MMVKLNIEQLRRAMAGELERRCCEGAIFSYGSLPGGPETLYGLTGAVNVIASLGLPLGDRTVRTQAAARILSWRNEQGLFDTGFGPGHAAHMVIGALNLLGEPVPSDMAPLAPLDTGELSDWLARHDWDSTHKELCGPAISILASGFAKEDWIEVFVRGVTARLDGTRPLETWCDAGAPPWRVISCLFHVLSIFDTGRIPYPEPELLIKRLLDLKWEEAPDREQRTFCTDADWAWMLLRLVEHRPRIAETALGAIRKVSARRVRAWHDDPQAVLSADTHHLYCYLWSTAVFQSCVRRDYTGGYLRDTFNDPSLFRLQPKAGG